MLDTSAVVPVLPVMVLQAMVPRATFQLEAVAFAPLPKDQLTKLTQP